MHKNQGHQTWHVQQFQASIVPHQAAMIIRKHSGNKKKKTSRLTQISPGEEKPLPH